MQFNRLVRQILEAVGDVPPPPPPAIIQKAEAPIRNVDVIAAALIGEAGGEGYRGMQAVMNVIVNRSKGKDLVRTAVANVLKPKQFSFFNDYNAGKQSMNNIINKAKQHPRWAQASEIALIGLSGKLEDITSGATHYHVSKGQSKVTPKWTHPSFGGKNTQALVTNTIGAHTFLKNVD